jgi:deoxyribodipyrimidine photolyase-related protein
MNLKLILGDQINYNHPWFKSVSDDYFIFIEAKSETNYVKHHIQKIAGIFSAMRKFSDYLMEKKFNVTYIDINHLDNKGSIAENLVFQFQKLKADKIYFQEPDELRLENQIKEALNREKINYEICSSEHFYTERYFLKDFFKSKKTYLMESFYRDMRKRHQILMEHGEPKGGKWNFDHNNRNKYTGKHPLPQNFPIKNNVSDIYKDIIKANIEFIGNIDADNFIWTIDRNQALEVLEYFCKNCLQNFGDYQDAMLVEESFLFHSRLSFAMNIKLLSPKEVVDRVVEEGERNKEIAISQIEGFVRQILGWREYMRGVYWAEMPGYEKLNFFKHKTHLPSFYWTGNTKMNCMKQAIKQSLNYAYAHHIQRLMITGNFALLLGVNPDEIDDWYLGIYIDAFQWVEITNTRGMSQFADGGKLATKPYISSANYINKMSNYCGKCHYNFKEKLGEKACPFNSLYWNFFIQHEDKLRKNPRIGMAYMNLDKMSDTEKQGIKNQANRYLNNIDEL